MLTRMLGRRGIYICAQNCIRFRQLQKRPFSNTSSSSSNSNSNSNSNNGGGGEKLPITTSTKFDAYKQLENLDFMTAAKILFTHPPKNKKFGIDFHLVQLFFVCLPSLAVYLVAQYARYDMRKMEAELEKKKKAEDEAKAKEMALKAEEEAAAAAANPELLEVKVRLEKLEEAIKEIVVESKKQSSDSIKKSNVDSSKQEQTTSNVPGNVHDDKKHASETTTTASGQGRTSAP